MAHYNNRDFSPDYHYAGGAPQYVPNPPIINPAEKSQARLQYEPQTPFYPPPPAGSNLQVPHNPRARPRSLPPPSKYQHRRSSRRFDDEDSDFSDRDPDGREHSPLSKARHIMKDTFTPSTTGLSVGLIGAIVGGFAARECTDTKSKSRYVSTVAGAVVGAMGANAIEKRIELGREKDKEKQEIWERKWRPENGRDVVRKDSGGRSGIRGAGWDEDDEDWVYDERERRDRSRGRRKSHDRYHS